MIQKISIFFSALLLVCTACDESYFPKPIGYARMDFPEHAYVPFESTECPFTFQMGQMAIITKDEKLEENPCWMNIFYPSLRAKIHLSYFDISAKELNTYQEDVRKLALKHLVKADNFEEIIVQDTVNNVYGVVYDFEGQAASNMQFYLTDKEHHFLRGALYFEVVPNPDSLAPAEIYVEQEIMRLVETIKWN